jgi:hypothetical protein
MRTCCDGVERGCSDCPNNKEEEWEYYYKTKDNVKIFRQFKECKETGKTIVEIIIKPVGDAKLEEFRFYEYIPKECVDDLQTVLDEYVQGEVSIKADPLIVWSFANIEEEERISYTLNKILSEECKEAILGMGIAERIVNEIPVGNIPPMPTTTTTTSTSTTTTTTIPPIDLSGDWTLAFPNVGDKQVNMVQTGNYVEATLLEDSGVHNGPVMGEWTVKFTISGNSVTGYMNNKPDQFNILNYRGTIINSGTYIDGELEDPINPGTWIDFDASKKN